MEKYIWLLPVIIICGVLAFMGFHIFRKMKQKKQSESEQIDNAVCPIDENATVVARQELLPGISIPIELLPAEYSQQENRLAEITNPSVIARITQTFPAIAETASRTVANAALKGMDVYRAILPGGETLAKSKDMVGAFRGFSLGKTGIQSQADLVKVDLTQTTAVANGIANIMNVGSLVVGQYYMSEISSKLETMTESIAKIGDFQDREFKSRILSAITLVSEISQFSAEIMENDEQTNRNLMSLDNLKGRATELLGQVNLTISETVNQNNTPTFKEYRECVAEFRLLLEYQNALVSVLDEISKLIYLLGKGSISAKLSRATYEKYLPLSVQARNVLIKWHETQIQALSIDLEKGKKTKTGLEGLLAYVPGVFDQKWKFTELSPELVENIGLQSSVEAGNTSDPEAVYDSDVKIIIQNGKYYYAPELPKN